MTFNRLAPMAATTMALALSLYTAGCAGLSTVTPSATPTPTPSADAHEDVNAESIEHMSEGPAVAVTAATFEATDSVMVVGSDHKRYDLTLVSSGSEMVGKVKFASAEAGDYTFFLNSDVALGIKDTGGETVAIEETGGAIANSSIKQHYVAELGVGQYYLHFGPTHESSVSLVIEGGARDNAH